MNSRFYKQLSLKSNRQTVAAGGPCGWQDGDASAVAKDVRVTQGDVVASSAASTTIWKGARGWSLDVSSFGKLTPERADARAIAFVTRTDGTTYQRPCYQDVKLRLSP